MKIKKLPVEIFQCVVKNTPLVSIDLIIEVKQNVFLLGKRKNPPAKGFFFVPGGRILKNEPIEEAFTRIVKSELNISYPFNKAKFLGVFEHFYPDNFLGNRDFGTHYVVLSYYIPFKKEIDLTNLPKEQHTEYQLFSKSEILINAFVHPYVKVYFREVI